MAGFRNNGTCVSNIRGKVELIRLLSWSKKLSGSFRINLSGCDKDIESSNTNVWLPSSI